MAQKRVALITGGGKGVGAGVARVFARTGMQLCIGYNSNETMAEQTLKGIEEKGGEAFLFKADVSDRDQVRAMVSETVARYGRIDVLVNNAAMQPNKSIDQYDEETFRWLWEINIGGYWRTTQECLPYLKNSDCPRIINISSVHGKRPAVFDPGYAMTKSAIRMFTREAAIELGHYGITVNTIDLGSCKIEGKTGGFSFGAWWPKGTHANPGFPLGHVVDPEDVGELALYLAGEGARNMSGAGIRLDGASMLV